MAVELYAYQLKAVNKMKNGCILCSGVGSGKSRTSLAYYFMRNGGVVGGINYCPMRQDPPPKDLYIITTARKRDTKEWEGELAPFLLSTDPKSNYYKNKVVIDSWNNIKKYAEVKNSFFIFDEQRVVGYGVWTHSFLKIAKSNEWILLSATPGDTWMDYVPVFIASGFFKNKSEFTREHVVWSPNRNFYQVSRYLNQGKLLRLRNSILVDMEDFKRETVQHHVAVFADYNKVIYKDICRDRWNPWEQKPIETATEFCGALRKLVNSDESRQAAVLELVTKHPKVIIFYNYNYELDILRSLDYGPGFKVAEWNGQKHEQIPTSARWVYLVQYTAGAEGWNCTQTDTIIFYSQNYSYKIMAQAAGRIDRLNTPYTDLWFFHLKSRSGIDLAISQAIAKKKTFNESGFAGSR